MTKAQVQVRSAIELDTTSLKTITKFATKKLGQPCDLVVKIDSQLIAGFKLNIEGIEHDYSVSGSIERLAQEL